MAKLMGIAFNKITKGSVSGASLGGLIGGFTGILLVAMTFVLPGAAMLMLHGPVANVLGLHGVLSTTMTTTFTGIVAGATGGLVMEL